MVKILSKPPKRLGNPESLFSGVVRIPIDSIELEAEWIMPPGAKGISIFAHGSGSSRHSRRNQFVAAILREAGIGTVLMDLLSREEERRDSLDGSMRFDIEFLTERLIAATRWIQSHPVAQEHRIGYFGASTGRAAAIAAASILDGAVSAVVSRGGRPDLAWEHLPLVMAPTLLIVGQRDAAVLKLNEEAYQCLRCPKKMAVIPGATHLFEEPGALEKVANLAAGWFQHHLSVINPTTELTQHTSIP